MRGWLRANWPYLVVFVAVGYTYTVDRQSDQERVERNDQICGLEERDHLKDVRNLRARYLYLDTLSPREARQDINQFVIADLPSLEAEARTDHAPEFCDEPGLGRPEPDPVLPKRRSFDYLLTPETRRKLKRANGHTLSTNNDQGERPTREVREAPPAAPSPRTEVRPPRRQPRRWQRPPRPAPRPPPGAPPPRPSPPPAPGLLEPVCDFTRPLLPVLCR